MIKPKHEIYKKIGFIQGRLSPIINNKIQIFPVENWKDEYEKASSLDIRLIEWTIDNG